MVKTYMPLLEQSLSAFNDWARDKPSGTKVPKVLGKATIELNGNKESRLNLMYQIWMFQRIYNAYYNMDDKDQQSVNTMLSSLKIEQLFVEPLIHQVELKKLRLYLT